MRTTMRGPHALLRIPNVVSENSGRLLVLRRLPLLFTNSQRHGCDTVVRSQSNHSQRRRHHDVISTWRSSSFTGLVPASSSGSTRNLSSNSFAATSTIATTAQATSGSDAESAPKVRLSKWISQRAAISRREAERLIRSGDVKLAGREIRAPATTILLSDLLAYSASSSLTVSGKPIRIMPQQHVSKGGSGNDTHANLQLRPTPVRVWLVHKLVGELVTESDPELQRPTLMQRMVQSGVGRSSHRGATEHLKPIGRLDMNTEGLILLTNCGSYARDMEWPAHRLHRTYRVRVHGKLLPYKLDAIRRGVRVTAPEQRTGTTDTASTTSRRRSAVRRTKSSPNRKSTTTAAAVAETTPKTMGSTRPVRYGPMRVTVEETRKKSTATNQWLQITCTEGKNRQIRNALAQFGLTVTRLIRISYGDYQLQTIPAGMVIEVPVKPIVGQKRQGRLVQPDEKSRRRTTSTAPTNAAISSLTSRIAKLGDGETTKPITVQWVRAKRVS